MAGVMNERARSICPVLPCVRGSVTGADEGGQMRIAAKNADLRGSPGPRLRRTAGRIFFRTVAFRFVAYGKRPAAAAHPGERAGLPREMKPVHGLVKDRQSVVWGKSVSVRVDLVGRRSITKKKTRQI